MDKEEGQPPNNDNAERERLLDGLQDNPKHMFAAYVDAMPLEWDLHFFPLSLYGSEMYRFLSDHSFVGEI